MSVVIHIDSPVVTVEEFHRLSGMPMGTIKDKLGKGELPTVALGLNPGKRERVMINMLKLVQMAENAEFIHPSMNEG